MIKKSLGKKKVDTNSLARKALADEEFMAELLSNMRAKDCNIRFNSFKILLNISENHPKVLYPKWDYFVELLFSKNTYERYQAVFMISNLVSVDKQKKFEKLFDKYFGILSEKATIVPATLVANAGKIAKAKPHLRKKITNKLLNIDKVHKGKQIEMIKAGAIEAFSEYFEEVHDKDAIIDFVKEQLNSKSPKTKRAAKEFINTKAGTGFPTTLFD